MSSADEDIMGLTARVFLLLTIISDFAAGVKDGEYLQLIQILYIPGLHDDYTL